MSYRTLDLPVPWSDTFDVLDSSKIQSLMDCPRGFFISYILGLKSEIPNVHLLFGSAMHEGLERMAIALRDRGQYDVDSVTDSIDGFLDTWQAGLPPQTGFLTLDPGSKAKNPGRAEQVLADYARFWKGDNFEVLFTEVAGTAPISPTRLLHFKMDTIFRDKQGVWSLEHKTTGRLSKQWEEQWRIKFQIACYTHALYCWFADEAMGVKINGIVLRTNDWEFLRIPIQLTPEQLQAWVWEANHWVDYLDWNMAELAKCKSTHPVLSAFPRNSESCSKFGCRYPEICGYNCNPLGLIENGPPAGYKIEHWDPRDREKTAKKVVHLTIPNP